MLRACGVGGKIRELGGRLSPDSVANLPHLDDGRQSAQMEDYLIKSYNLIEVLI